jgi:type II secretory pathway pseudopilin PulG
MVVIAVIGILAALTVTAAMKVRSTMRVRGARADAQRLAQALEAYQALRNFLPVHNFYNANTDGDLVYENCDVIRQINGIMSRDPLLKLERRELSAAGSFKDPWGRPFRIVMWKDGEPFTDLDQNGDWDSGEPYTDQNSNGKWDGDQFFKYFEVYSCGENAKWEMGAGDDLVPRL